MHSVVEGYDILEGVDSAGSLPRRLVRIATISCTDTATHNFIPQQRIKTIVHVLSVPLLGLKRLYQGECG